jgi:hypothetical protein
MSVKYVVDGGNFNLKTNKIMEKSAVEWLEFRYKNNINLMEYDFEQAKEMFEQQIIDSHCKGQGTIIILDEAEQYYNETFKNK